MTIAGRGGEWQVSGSFCERGKEYAIQEITNPIRILTTTIKLTDGRLLPVKSADTIYLSEQPELIKLLRGVNITSPVAIGQVIESQIGKTKVNIVATADA
jgi:CxxC motif-containing protein